MKSAKRKIQHAQIVVQIVQWPPPLVWLLNRTIRRLREQAVDEMTLVALREEAESYLGTLLRMARLGLGRAASMPGMVGIIDSRGALKVRIPNILQRPFPRTARLGTWGRMGILALGLLILPMAEIRGVRAPRTLTSRKVEGGGAAIGELTRQTVLTRYTIRAGGAANFVGITNSPSSNRVGLVFSKIKEGRAVFRLTNAEPHGILLWNVRVQTRSTGPGTDGFGWDTVADDYPNIQRAALPPGSSEEFTVEQPDATPWRVCIVYAIDWTESGKHYQGDYEVCGREVSGMVTGRVRLAGTLPEEVVLRHLMNNKNFGSMQNGMVSSRDYLVSADKGLADVFVYVKSGLEEGQFDPSKMQPVLEQKEGLCKPYVLGVMTGQKIKIRNSDPVMHTLFVTSKTNPERNFTTSPKGGEIETRFDRPELMIRCKADVSEGTSAYLNVVENPFFAVTDANGNFTISGLPPGRFKLGFIHPKAGQASAAIEVGEGVAQANAELRVSNP